MAKYAEITGWGKCMPPAVMTNDDMATVLDTSDEWIRTRSGIRERRVSHVPCSDLAAVAAHRALAGGGTTVEEVDLLIVATCSPDTLIPSMAAHVQKKMGAVNAAVFHLNAGCSGFIYSLAVATAMVRSGGYRKAVVIGAERLTWLLNWSLRDTAVLFGDGAGAVLVEPSDRESGLLASHLGCEGDALDALLVPNLGTAGNRFVEDYEVFDVSFDGREIFRRAVKGMAKEIRIVGTGPVQQGASFDLSGLIGDFQASRQADGGEFLVCYVSSRVSARAVLIDREGWVNVVPSETGNCGAATG